MNARQILEVATKVFVDQDQEARQEADRKMKRKADLLAAALAGQSGRPWEANTGRGRSNHQGQQQMHPECPTLGRTRAKLMSLLLSERALEE
jgi:hypothetical protein